MNRIPLAACDHNYSRRREARIRLLPLAAALLCCASSFDARAAGALPATAALRHERAEFTRLRRSPEAAAKRHLFFARTAAARALDRSMSIR